MYECAPESSGAGRAPRCEQFFCGMVTGAARVLITDIAGPGDVLGLSAVVSGAPCEVTAETLDPCRLFFVGRE